MTQTTQRCVLFEVSSILRPIYGVKSLKNPILDARIDVFQPFSPNIETSILSKTTSIVTKFCTMIETTEYSSRVVQITANKSKMANGRHVEKSKIAISPCLPCTFINIYFLHVVTFITQLHICVSRVLAATGLDNGKSPFSTIPQIWRPLTDHQKIVRWLRPRLLLLCKI